MAGNQREGGDDRRLTKAERRDQARIQREEIQRKMARRRRNRSIGLVLLVVAVATIVVAVFLTTSGGAGIPSAEDLLKEAPAATKTAGCDAVQTTPNYNNAKGDDPDIDHAHIGTPPVTTPPPLSTYPTIPPASGPHDPTPLSAGIYSSPPNVYSAIHALEHGGTIIWYAPGTSSDQLTQLLAFYGQPQKQVDVGQDRVIIAPFSYPDQGDAGQLPKGVQMALVAWHRLQTCANVNLAVAFDFTSQYSFPSWNNRPWKGVAREPGGIM